MLKLKSQHPASRCDGLETKARIIDCAGKLIAQNGYAKTTSKAICAAAGTNMAAVNYHFGSRDGLYKAVLEDVHNYLINLEQMNAIYQSGLTPREKIASFLELYINSILQENNWRLEVWSRELMAPSPFIKQILQHKAMPKLDVLTKIFAEYLNLPANDPKIYIYIITTMAPFVLTFLARHSDAKNFVPSNALLPETAELMKTFVFAGLEAFKQPGDKQ